jgi:hypothetical protein
MVRYIMLPTDPRDKIFGLLSLIPFSLRPDYSMSCREVYCAFAKEWKESRDDICTILIHSGVGCGDKDTLQLPSWVPNFYAISHREVGHSGRIQVLIHAADSDLDSFQIPASSVDINDVLHIKGIIVDDIKKVEGRLLPGDMLQVCSEYVSCDCNKKYRTGITKLQAVIRLLLESTNCVLEGNDVSMLEMVVVLLQFLTSRAHKHDEALKCKWIDDLGLQPERDFFEWYTDRLCLELPPEHNFATKSVHDTLQFSSSPHYWRISDYLFTDLLTHRIFETSSGYLGLGRKLMLPGDLICVLKGCSYPLVLRKVDNQDYYFHVGTCYALGLMEGEAAEFLRTGHRNVQKFEIH